MPPENNLHTLPGAWILSLYLSQQQRTTPHAMTIHRLPTHDSDTLALTDCIAALLREETTVDHPDQPHGTVGVSTRQDELTGEVVIRMGSRRFKIELNEIL